MFAPELETLSRTGIERLQHQRLGHVLAHAWNNVPLYRQRFAEAGVTPDSYRALPDLARFPFTYKDDLRRNYPFGLFAVPRDRIVRLHASSGTTGKPTVVGYTAGDLDVWADLMARSLACAGARRGDVVHNALNYGLFTGGLGIHDGAERLGCTVVPVSGGNTERQLMLLRDLGANVLCATPSYALTIADVAAREGIDLSRGSLRVGVLGGEPWSEAMRAELDARLGLRACDSYGLSEIMGPGVAMECAEMRDGLHGWEDHFLFEIIDPDAGTPLPPEATGELVITTLSKEGMPLVRYRTRDITRLTRARCDCGRTHVRIRRVTGRNDDMLIIRGVNVYPSQIEAVLVGLPGIAPHYQLVVRREGTLDTLAIEVEARADATATGDYAAIGRSVGHHVKAMVGVRCEVLVREPGSIPRFEGKAVRVRDERPKPR
ncbi:MAG: phenylacetate--CoA ligase [Gammaproteobacteria bacterium]|nr:phenylacetate--CoA ligase [Gammaproteobacteria bacterium]